MKKIILAAALTGLAVTAHAADEAVVVATSIDPVFDTSTRTECTQASATPGWLGQALGAVVGGAAGSQVGKGSGQAAAAAIGATLGAQAGAAMSNNGNGTAREECRQITERRLAGYSVRARDGRSIFVPRELAESVK